jgi:hypothetical protein
MPLRRVILTLVLILATAAASAEEPGVEPVQFLDRSVVTLPRFVGAYTLAEALYDPEQWAAGVTSKWRVNSTPAELRLTVFVYPLGRSREDAAVEQQIEDVERSLHLAVEQGTYSDLVVGAREPFSVAAPDAWASPDDARDAERERDARDTPKGQRRAKRKAESDATARAVPAGGPLAGLFADAAKRPPSRGLRQSFRFSHDGVPMRSLGYVFHRHLFGFKVRATVPVDSMDEATFTALVDTATLNLVPRIAVKNFGRCGIITVGRPAIDSKQDASDAMGQLLMQEVARVRAENCATAEKNPPPPDAEAQQTIQIVYPPETWKRSD